MLKDAEFDGESIDERQAKWIIGQGRELLDRASECAAFPQFCASIDLADN